MKYLHRYICHIRDSSTTKSKQSVCDIFSSRQQDAVIMRHFNYSPDKYMVSISNNNSLTILWIIQINSKKNHTTPCSSIRMISLNNEEQTSRLSFTNPLSTFHITIYSLLTTQQPEKCLSRK